MESFPNQENKNPIKKHNSFMENARSVLKKVTVGVGVTLISYPLTYYLATEFMKHSPEEAHEIAKNISVIVGGYSGMRF
ncbi:MAG: hypothetical protein ACK4FA_02320 [Candidatus Paceibacteria bacterium]